MAVIEWAVDTVKVEVENVAWPLLTVPVPRVADPFLNVTAPLCQAIWGRH